MVEADNERLSYAEIAEIDAAYAEIPDDMLGDFRDNASVADMLVEIEAQYNRAVKINGRVVKIDASK